MKRMMRKMNSGGDEKIAEYEAGVTSPQQLEKIEKEFNELKAKGWLAADVTDKKDELIDKFDPKADILMIPRMSGGSNGRLH